MTERKDSSMRDERATGCRYTAVVTLIGALSIGGICWAMLPSNLSFMESFAWSAIGFLLGAIIWPTRS